MVRAIFLGAKSGHFSERWRSCVDHPSFNLDNLGTIGN